MTRILLVDDHRMFREGLRGILERAGISVTEAENGREGVAVARQEPFDVIVMDISMAELNGIDATRQLAVCRPEAKVIGLSMNSDARYAAAMFAAGAVGYVSKGSASRFLLEAIHQVLGGGRYTSPQIVGVSSDGRSAPTPRGPAERRHSPSAFEAARELSPREREVLQLLAEGKSSKEIGTDLDIAVSTVETHRRQIAQKLGVRTIAELTKCAVRLGLTSLE